MADEKGTIATYDSLPDEAKGIVDAACAWFGDAFDNSMFGPFVEEFTGFSKDRMAQLVEPALGDVLTYVGIQGLNFTVANYPYKMSIAKRCLSLAMTVEVIRHLMRSYVEIPDTSRVGTNDLVRRDYLSRWGSLLNDYIGQLEDAAQQLGAELFVQDAAAGRYLKTLIDYPSAMSSYIPWQPAERPMWAGWWL